MAHSQTTSTQSPDSDPAKLRNTGFTTHAVERYEERTPDGVDLPHGRAWDRGEFIDHPQVARHPFDPRPLEAARIYRHGQDWDVIFLVQRNTKVGGSNRSKDYVVVTTTTTDMYDHGPTRAYLHGHSPHNS